jgi:hypothetical protein
MLCMERLPATISTPSIGLAVVTYRGKLWHAVMIIRPEVAKLGDNHSTRKSAKLRGSPTIT